MQDTIFFKYFKKNSRSASPPQSRTKNTLNDLLGSPFKPNIKKEKRSFSPQDLPEIEKKPPTNEKVANLKKIQTNPDIYTRIKSYKHLNVHIDKSSKNIADTLISPHRTQSKIQRIVVEKDEKTIIKKYKDIREQCLNNEIKLLNALNGLKTEMGTNGNTLTSLSLSLEILNIVNSNFYFQVENPLEMVIQTLQSFLYLKEGDIMEKISKIMKEKKWEIKKTPLINIIEKLCFEFNKKDDNIKKCLKEKEEETESLLTNIMKLNEDKQALQEKLDNFKKMACSTKEKEIFDLNSKISQNEIEKKHLLNEIEKLKSDTVNQKQYYSSLEKNMKSEFSLTINELHEQIAQSTKVLESKEKEFEALRENFMKLVNQQKDLMVYLKHLKEKIAISEDRSSKLMTENQSLKIRAAVAWEEFTPRPDYTRTFEVLSLSPQNFSGKSSKQIIEEITEQFSKNLNFGSQNSLKERAIKIFTRGKNSSSRTFLASKTSRKNSIECSDEIEENICEKKKI